jgi:predicted glutamine amidotransferase
MCRFLLLASDTPSATHETVLQFAQMCRRSTGHAGDWQGDGWGVAWWDEPAGWCLYRSVLPIWTEPQVIRCLPSTRQLLVHARSASFAEQKGDVSYNQPYIVGPYAFVFFGLLKGVCFPRKVPGAIGAAKVWTLVREQLRLGVPLQQALARVYAQLDRYSREIRACNLGVSNGQEYAWYNGNPQGQAYYQLHYTRADTWRMVSSEPFGPWSWQNCPGVVGAAMCC